MSYKPLNLRPFDPNLSTFAAQNLEYTNEQDDLATIKTAGYFSKTIEDTSNIANSLKVDDLLYIKGSDGAAQLRVTAIDPVIIIGGSQLIVAFNAPADNGQTTTIFNAPGVVSTDVGLANINSTGVGALDIRKVVPGTDIVTIDLSVAADAATVLGIIVTRST